VARRNVAIAGQVEQLERILREDDSRVGALRAAVDWIGSRGGVYPCAAGVLQAAGTADADAAAVIAVLNRLGAPVGTRGMLSRALFDLAKAKRPDSVMAPAIAS